MRQQVRVRTLPGTTPQDHANHVDRNNTILCDAPEGCLGWFHFATECENLSQADNGFLALIADLDARDRGNQLDAWMPSIYTLTLAAARWDLP